jgi:hypothetical protein
MVCGSQTLLSRRGNRATRCEFPDPMIQYLKHFDLDGYFQSDYNQPASIGRRDFCQAGEHV